MLRRLVIILIDIVLLILLQIVVFARLPHAGLTLDKSFRRVHYRHLGGNVERGVYGRPHLVVKGKVGAL